MADFVSSSASSCPNHVTIVDVRKLLEQSPDSTTTATALSAISTLDGRESLDLVSRFATPESPIEVQSAAIAAVGTHDVARAAKLAVQLIPKAQKESDVAQLVLPVVSRRGGAIALAKGIDAAKLPADSALLAYRALTAAGDSDPTLAAALHNAMGARNELLEYSPELVKQVAGGAANGDATRGRKVYEAKLANCSACHRIAGQGGDIGPELSNIGKQLSPEQIAESVLWPNRVVKEGYMAVRVVTDDGLQFAGYKLKETPTDFHLREASTGKVLRFARGSIEDVASAGSVMPSGLAASMTRQELYDLVRYLSELGKATSQK